MQQYNQKKQVKAIMKMMLSYLGRGGIIAMLVAGFAVIIAGILASLPAMLLGRIVDLIIESGSSGSVWPLFGLIIIVLLGRILLVLIQKFLVERAAVALRRDVSMGNILKIMTIRVDAIQRLRAGEVAARLDKRVHGIVRLVKLVFLEAVPQLAIAIPAVVFAFYENLLAGTVVLSVLALSAIITIVQVRSQKGIRIQLIDKSAGLAGQISELAGHLDYVRIADTGWHVKNRFDKETDDIKNIEFRHHKWMMGFDALKGFVEDFGQALIVGIGIALVISNQMTPGTILTLVMLYRGASVPLKNLHRVVDELHESVLQVDAASAIVDPVDDPNLKGLSEPTFRKSVPLIRARNLKLSRKMDDGSSLNVLNGINLDISEDEVIGVVGTSGCGKTTLLNTILGLHHDYEGELEVFGTEVRDLSKSSQSSVIGYGPQRPYIRQGTVRENIAESLSKCGTVNDSSLMDAMTSAQLDFQLDKVLDESGDNLSLGQIQRLSLARVFAKKNARLVVLDEATSGLDGATQSKIMTELKSHSQGRAMIMVAHRLDTLKWADRIIVLDKGDIVQEGTFQELSTIPGEFANLMGHPADQQKAA